ncbi:blastula protease 10-like [Watersipora subatra]|uniref:blastula protease 10-like n=1 Tax=Watersipora subatra TaxID=2589382 RepID=UPI00355B6796
MVEAQNMLSYCEQLQTFAVFTVVVQLLLTQVFAEEVSCSGSAVDGISEMDYRIKQFQLARQDILYEKDGEILDFQPLSYEAFQDLTMMKTIAETNQTMVTSDIYDSDTLQSTFTDIETNSEDEAIPTDTRVRKKRQVRLSAIRGANVWPSNIVVYYIDLNTYRTAFSRGLIQTKVSDGLRALELLTCVKFIERSKLDSVTQARIGHRHSVRIFNGNRCWSHSGCTGCHRQTSIRTTQDLSLATSCTSAEIVQHEFGHVLGLTHEHTRTDMHKHIVVNYTLVRNPVEFYRKTHPEFINKAPYDLSSIQHYQTSALLTHSPDDMWLKTGIGRLTHYDEWSINAAYCAVGCDKSLCKNDGYMTNRDGRCKCICPKGLTGPTCEVIATDVGPKCGGEVQLTSQYHQKVLETPNLTQPYDSPMTCVWLIKAPAGKIIESKITYLNLPADSSGCKHYVEIRDKLLGQVAREKCGRCTNGNCFTSQSAANVSLVIFEAQEHAVAGRGFRMNIQLKDDCNNCRGAPCRDGHCYPKYGDMRCDFEEGLLGGCSDIKIHDAYQKPYDDFTWTESAWEIAEQGPRLTARNSITRSAGGRLHLLSIRPRNLTRGPYEGVFRIVPYMIYPERSRCLKFEMFLCCDSMVTLRVHTAMNGELSTNPVLFVTEHENRWREVELEIKAPTYLTSPEPIEVVFFSSHTVPAGRGTAHLGIDNIEWRFGSCQR